MVKPTLTNIKNTADIEEAIRNALGSSTIVDDEQAAQDIFREWGDAREVRTRLIYKNTASVYNPEQDGNEYYDVMIHEHYTDPGSTDYVYSYTITQG